MSWSAAPVQGNSLSQRLRRAASSLRTMTRQGRAWAAEHPKQSAILITCAILAPVSVTGIWWWNTRPPNQSYITSELALATLDAGEWERARAMALVLKTQGLRPPQEWSTPDFVMGATIAYEAASVWEGDRETYCRRAALYLEAARQHGFPAGREAEGLWLLGRSLYWAGHFPESREVLLQALKIHRGKRTEIYLYLSGANQYSPNPNLPQALEFLDRYLADESLSPEERSEGLVRRVRVLLGMSRIREAQETFAQLTEAGLDPPRLQLLSGHLLLEEARNSRRETSTEDSDVTQKLRQAIESLREVQAGPDPPDSLIRTAQLLIAQALSELREEEAALFQYDRLQKTFPQTSEGFAARVFAAALAERRGAHDQAVELYRAALSSVTDPSHYSNEWVSAAEFGTRVMRSYRGLLQKQDYALAAQLAEAFFPFFPKVIQLENLANAYAGWGAKLAGTAPTDRFVDEPPPKEAEERWRLAGKYYHELSRERYVTQSYPEDVWLSGVHYLAGESFEKSAEAFRTYLEYETRGQLRQLAHLRLAESLAALGELEEAIREADAAVDLHARDPAIYEARLLASRLHREAGDHQKAEAMLRANLVDDRLEPISPIWRSSLFDLGKTLYQQGVVLVAESMQLDPIAQRTEMIALLEKAHPRFEEAVAKFHEVLRRGGVPGGTVEASFLSAEAHRQMALLPKKKLDTTLVDATRLALMEKAAADLDQALGHYEDVKDALNAALQNGPLTEQEEFLLRNAYFSHAAVLFELGRYEQAAGSFDATTTRFQDTPEVMDAFVQLATCYRNLGETDRALSTLLHARTVLDRFPPETPFRETTIHNREEWEQQLDWLARQFSAS